MFEISKFLLRSEEEKNLWKSNFHWAAGGGFVKQFKAIDVTWSIVFDKRVERIFALSLFL